MRRDRADTPPGLPRVVQALIGAAVPPELRDPIIGDFEEQYVRRRRHSAASATLWLTRELLASTLSWLGYWFTRRCSARVALAVCAGVGVALVGLVVVDHGPVQSLVDPLPGPFRRFTVWLLEGVLVVAVTLMTFKLGRREAHQALCGLVCVLLFVPVGRYGLGGGDVGLLWLAVKGMLVLGSVALGAGLASRVSL